MAKKSAATTADAAPAPAEGAAAKPYTVLARRYRSRDFGEVVGQEPIARTLQNAIAARRTAHAYLFCGTRGVGKTSMARIFARALNRNAALSEGDAIGEARQQDEGNGQHPEPGNSVHRARRTRKSGRDLMEPAVATWFARRSSRAADWPLDALGGARIRKRASTIF